MTDEAARSILGLDPDRARREALRANEALMRYGQHDEDCPHLDGVCDCGLDAACYSPFIEDRGESPGETVDRDGVMLVTDDGRTLYLSRAGEAQVEVDVRAAGDAQITLPIATLRRMLDDLDPPPDLPTSVGYLYRLTWDTANILADAGGWHTVRREVASDNDVPPAGLVDQYQTLRGWADGWEAADEQSRAAAIAWARAGSGRYPVQPIRNVRLQVASVLASAWQTVEDPDGLPGAGS